MKHIVLDVVDLRPGEYLLKIYGEGEMSVQGFLIDKSW